MTESDASDAESNTARSLQKREMWCKTQINTQSCNFVWSLEKFSYISRKIGESLESMSFKTSHQDPTQWYLLLYPSGIDEKSRDWVSLQLAMKSDASREILVNVKLWIIGSNGIPACEKTARLTLSASNPLFTCDNFIEVKKLKSRKDLLSEDKLSLGCFLEVSHDETVTFREHKTIPVKRLAPRFSRTGLLVKDFHALFNNQKYADIDLLNGTEKFPAHKVVLAARSQFFAEAIYGKGDTVTVLPINDVSGEVLGLVLTYVYTGKVKKLPTSVSSELMKAGKLFRLEGLSDICKERLIEDLTAENASHVLLLAEEQGDNELKEAALHCLTNNALGQFKQRPMDLHQRTQLFGEVVSLLSTTLLKIPEKPV